MTENVSRPQIVAELSGNHEGDINRALALMDLAVECGADAVKIQTYTEDSLTIDSKRPEFQITAGLWRGQSLYELYKRAKTPREWMKPLFAHARERGILLFSSPFSAADVEVLEEAGCPVYKIASYELNDVDLIALCASTGKPMVLSTGLAELEEIDRAVELVVKGRCPDYTLLHCESRYPADPTLFNLRTIPFFKQRYGCKAGLSNHALGDVLDVAATALGADMIEKHFTDDRSRGSVDSAFSMEPDDLRALVADTAAVAASLGRSGVFLKEDEYPLRNGRRSVYLVKDLKEGESLTREHVKVIRPGLGLEPYRLAGLLGHKAKSALKAPLPLEESMFE
ncbi:MAG: pseudaminic acid synthase [Succinivibrio sp.]|nr:pseudaminic acid synthase [Succinivibrio sp.]